MLTFGLFYISIILYSVRQISLIHVLRPMKKAQSMAGLGSIWDTDGTSINVIDLGQDRGLFPSTHDLAFLLCPNLDYLRKS